MILLDSIDTELKERLKPLLLQCKTFDITIESILDDRINKNTKIYVDNLNTPKSVNIIQGTFIICTGDTDNSEAINMLKSLKPHYGIQPNDSKWIALAKEIHKDRLTSRTRYSFSGDNINRSDLNNIISNNNYRKYLKKIDLDIAKRMMEDELQKYHFFSFDSPKDFMENSFGFCVEVDNKVLSACTACLLSNSSAEINIITSNDSRGKGLASLVAAQFILYCFEHGLRPHWDGANLASYGLACKLGFEFCGEYEVYLLK